jgi:hypothetical protein
MEISNSDHLDKIQATLRQLFDKAAVKVSKVDSLTDAEPEMVSFLRYVQEHPEQHQLIVRMFTDALLSREGPWEIVQFCLHALRWPEMREFVESQRLKSLNEFGARASRVWDHLLKAFDDDWEDADNYQEYRKSAGGSSRHSRESRESRDRHP